jgi:beta-phosphoglucomutase
MVPKAVLFDHDGVLANSEAAHMRAWRRMLQEKGVPFSESDFAGQIGRTGPEILQALVEKHRPDLQLDRTTVVEWVDLKNVYYRKGLISGPQLEPFDGVREGLAWMKAVGMRCAVVSNARRSELVSGLKATGIEPYFSSIVSRDDTPASKPDPTHFLTACAELGLKPSECWGIDDSPTGLTSSLLAGLVTFSVTTSFAEEELQTPVPGRPDLRPKKIYASMREFFSELSGGKVPREG